MPKGYHHLTHEQGCQIYTLKRRGDSSLKIAKFLGVHCSTIYRELQRNKGDKGYRYQQAHRKATERRFSYPRKMTSELISIIEEKLRLQWSPEQIAEWLKKHDIAKVSHESIYKHVWADKRP